MPRRAERYRELETREGMRLSELLLVSIVTLRSDADILSHSSGSRAINEYSSAELEMFQGMPLQCSLGNDHLTALAA